MKNSNSWALKAVCSYLIIFSTLALMQNLLVVLNPAMVHDLWQIIVMVCQLAILVGATAVLFYREWGRLLTIYPLFTLLFVGFFQAVFCFWRPMDICNPYSTVFLFFLLYGLPVLFLARNK